MALNKTMPCPVCGAWTDITDTRVVKATPNARRRRYECANGHRFITLLDEVLVSILDDKGKYVNVEKTK